MAKDNPEVAGDPQADGEPKSSKPPRSPGERAMASLRSARRLQNDISDPAERSKMLLAEANVLALLDLAEALAGSAGSREVG